MTENSHSVVSRRQKEILDSALCSSSFFTGNIKIARLLHSHKAAIFLGAIMTRKKILERTRVISIDDDWFWFRQEEIEEETALDSKNQTRSSNLLLKAGLLSKKRHGKFGRNLYRVNYDVLAKFIGSLESEAESISSHFVLRQDENNQESDPMNGEEMSLPQDKMSSQNRYTTYNNNYTVQITEEKKTSSVICTDSQQAGCAESNHKNDFVGDKAITFKKSKFNKPPISQRASEGIQKLTKKMQEQNRPHRKKQEPMVNIPEDVRMLIDYWAELGFKIPNPEKAPGQHNKNIRSLKAIQKGTLIHGDIRRFNPDDIKIAMEKFAKLVFDPQFGPDDAIKDHLSKLQLSEFLYNPHGRTVKSWMMKSHDEQVKPRVGTVEDKMPTVTNRLKGFYQRYALAGIKKRFTLAEENKFREASSRIVEFYDRFAPRINGVDRGYAEIADLLCKSLQKQFGDQTTKIFPSTFPSSFAFAGLVKYMNQEGYFTDYEACNANGF